MKEIVNKFLKDKWFLILIGILILAIIIRLWVFLATVNQPIWWDEGDYLTVAKKIGLSLYPHIDITKLSNPRRPLLLPLLWAGVFKIGLGEATIRFIQVIFSVFAVLLTYLIGKEMFNRKVGLIASFLMSTFWLNLFFTGRLLLEIPTTTFLLASCYFFWKGYANNKGAKYIWLFGIFFGLSVFTRAASLIMIIPLLIFVLTKDRINFIKNKHLWVAIFLFLLIFSPFLIWVGLNYGNAFKSFTGIGAGRFADFTFNTLIHGNTKEFIKFLPTYLQIPFFVVFLFGLIFFLDMFLGLDLLFKEEGSRLRKKLFILLWIIIPLLFFGITTSKSYMEPRYLISIFPAIFMVIGIGIIKIYEYIKKYEKRFALIVIALILLIGSSYQLSYANDVINSKKSSYLQVKDAAIWIKEHSEKDDNFFIQSVPQSMYYSEMECYGYPPTEKEYIAQLKNLKPKYMVVSVFESHPDWVYKYPEKNSLKPVQIYMLDQKTPLLFIYNL